MDVEQSAGLRRNDDPPKIIDLSDHECVQSRTSDVNVGLAPTPSCYRHFTGNGRRWMAIADGEVASTP